MEKQSLNVKLNSEIYYQLKSEIGKGKISVFVENLIVKELNSSDKKVEREYREAYDNSRLLTEAKQWERAGIANWVNREKQRKDGRKSN